MSRFRFLARESKSVGKAFGKGNDMRWLWASALVVTLASFRAAVQADEVVWQSSRPTPPATTATWRSTFSPSADGPLLEPAALDLGVQQVALAATTTEPPLAGEQAMPGMPRNLPAPAEEQPPPEPPPAPPVASVEACSSPAEGAAMMSCDPAEAPVGVPGDPSPGDVFELPLPTNRLEVSADYLYWWVRGSRLPVLATTAPSSDPEASRGVLGVDGTKAVLGNQEIDDQARSGGRVSGTYWLDLEQQLGVELGGFILPQVSTGLSAGGAGMPVLAQPFYNISLGQPDRRLVASPGDQPGDVLALTGHLNVETSSRLWGAEAAFRRGLVQTSAWQVDVLGGVRYLDLQEGLHVTADSVSQRSVPGASAFDAGNDLLVSDGFDTRNQFYGGQLGARVEWRSGLWTIQGRAGVALGFNREVVDIAGSQTVTTPGGGRQTVNTGFLALDSNSGHFHQDRFAVVPEVGLKVSCQLTTLVSAYVGYDALYWPGVVRPADQVDLNLEGGRVANLLPPSPLNRTAQTGPNVPLRQTGFWAQGVSAGLELRY
jgi:hypothetical protein